MAKQVQDVQVVSNAAEKAATIIRAMTTAAKAAKWLEDNESPFWRQQKVKCLQVKKEADLLFENEMLG